MERGLAVVERQLATAPPPAARHGDRRLPLVLAADFNARRFDAGWIMPTVMRVFDATMQLPAFESPSPAAAPEAVAGRSDGCADWLQRAGLPREVGALMTTRAGGASQAPWDSLNLGAAVGRPGGGWRLIAPLCHDGGRRPCFWSRSTARLGASAGATPGGDGLPPPLSTCALNPVCLRVLVADCLPVLFCAMVFGRHTHRLARPGRRRGRGRCTTDARLQVKPAAAP